MVEFRADPGLSASGAPPLCYYVLSLLVDGSPGQLKMAQTWKMQFIPSSLPLSVMACTPSETISGKKSLISSSGNLSKRRTSCPPERPRRLGFPAVTFPKTNQSVSPASTQQSFRCCTFRKDFREDKSPSPSYPNFCKAGLCSGRLSRVETQRWPNMASAFKKPLV